MSTLTVTRGLPGAGKSTWAKAWVAESPTTRARINRDDLRGMLYDAPHLPWELEQAITVAQRAAVKALLDAGRDVVTDDMNLRPRYVREWAKFAAEHGHDFEVFELPLSVEEAIERDAGRPRPLGPDVIRSIAERGTNRGRLIPLPDDVFDLPAPPAPYRPRQNAPRAIIVDIDGTMALNPGRNPYDMTRVHEDIPNWPVIEAVTMARANGYGVIFCSGRDETARTATELWLARYGFTVEPLLMRAAGDTRRDSTVKRELFDNHIRDLFDIRFVLDDRDQVVKMWRGLGLTVFQVAEGNF